MLPVVVFFMVAYPTLGRKVQHCCIRYSVFPYGNNCSAIDHVCKNRGAFSCAGSLAGACMRHGGQQVVQLNAQLQGTGKMAEVNIGCVPKLLGTRIILDQSNRS